MMVREATVTYRMTRRTDCDRSIRSSRDVARLATPWVEGEGRERFYVLLVDSQHRYLGHEMVSLGSLSSSIVHPREVFRLAVREQAAGVVLVHNHPSGDPEPSSEDRAVTKRLVAAGEVLDVEVLDHIIIAGDRWWSFRDAGELQDGGIF